MDYFFELQLTSNQSLNYSETYFELDSEEATHCDHCHLICCVYIKGRVSICVNAPCLMLEVLKYIALNALNTVQKIKAMSKMSKIDKVHIRGVRLCMSKMSKMGKEHTHTFWLITSLILNGFSIRKKFWKAET